MKILYAADNRIGSFLQFERFLNSIKNKNFKIKTAAYKKSSAYLNVDYTLDALLNFTNPNKSISFNGNYNYYVSEIRRFKPDIIISDLEIYTSIIAIELNIPLILASPNLLYYGIDKKLKYNIGIAKTYKYLFYTDKVKNQYIKYILNNASKKFIISHLCDIEQNIELKSGYSFIRPDFLLTTNNEKEDYITVDFFQSNINRGKKINNLIEYKKQYENYMKTSKKLYAHGNEYLIADAFYNQKNIGMIIDPNDQEVMISSKANEYFGFGNIVDENNLFIENKDINIKVNDNVKFLNQIL